MFRELTYISCILGVSTFGTELIFRFKPENKTTDVVFNTQSDMVLAATAVEAIVSILTLKIIDTLTAIKMKLTALFLLALLCSAIALRARYEFFGPLSDTKYNLYNSTSFFLVITTIIWIPFLFFKKATPLEEVLPTSAIQLSETLRTRREEERRTRHRHEAVNRSNDIEMDETLPSYYELPVPPAYTKANVPVEEEEEEGDMGCRAMYQQQQQQDYHDQASSATADVNSPARNGNDNLEPVESSAAAVTTTAVEDHSSTNTSQNNNNTMSPQFAIRSAGPRR